ncbi:uncharacterized protein LOC133196447 [Saccostrea echinata]|uniref:uncharacterized protein LOC133196447 n=1 Tax=Saccostrea echinata TaxID=191078 RepID=UPI002A81891F|nr:uncharacterized protein LOC133196447 [Saccostrea echinata]
MKIEIVFLLCFWIIDGEAHAIGYPVCNVVQQRQRQFPPQVIYIYPYDERIFIPVIIRDPYFARQQQHRLRPQVDQIPQGSAGYGASYNLQSLMCNFCLSQYMGKPCSNYCYQES